MLELGQVVALVQAAAAVVATAHVVLVHPQVRGAMLWVTVIWLVPWVGPLLYLLFGINRMPRTARARALLGLGGDFDWCEGNEVAPLIDGDAAYPAMLEAIEQAQTSVHLSTYIFDNDRVGSMFCKALGRAVGRGVHVRVLIDAVGVRYSRPTVLGRLARAGVTAALFSPTRMPWRWPYANLRNHRKLLVLDGSGGFIGGMNIREACLLSAGPPDATRDLHFRVSGPVVADMESLFASDWLFATGERLESAARTHGQGRCRARLIQGGPDRTVQSIRWLKLAAAVRANSLVRIMTPYFVPDEDVVTALCAAVSAGVRVQVVLPSRNNLRLVAWASRGCWTQLIERGIEILLSPAPFEHTKLMLIDDALAIVGSANWDERSFRLNFECDLECLDARLVTELGALVDSRIAVAHRVTLSELRRLPLALRLRDRAAWLALPYL